MSESRRGVTRLLVADAIDDYDDQLADLQEMKKAVYQNYRAALASRGFSKLAISAEVSTLKLAIRQRRNIEKDAEAAKARRGLFDEILTEITAAPSRARAHAREEEHRDPAAEIAELVADEVAAAETAAKLAEEETTPEERRKAQIKAAADRAEARSRGGAARTH
jgi:prophage antirepressor-like protein